MSRRRRGSNARVRRVSAPEQPVEEHREFWEGAEPLPDSPSAIALTEDPAAVVRSLGPPPLSGREQVAEHYFEAVYQRAVAIASALAAAGHLLDESDED